MGSVVSDRIKSYFRFFLRLIFGRGISALGNLNVWEFECQRIHPGMTIPYPRAPTGRTEHRLHQLLCFVDLRAPRWGADHFTHIPGCQVAPFAFTASSVGAKKNEKIFEKRSSHRPGIGACLCSSGRKGDVAGNHGRKTRSGLPRPHRKKKNQAIRFFQTLP
jgi:hypothetical protein